MTKKKDYLITKETKGIFNTDLNGYRIIKKDNLKDYVLVKIPANATFKVINFNVHTKRVFLFVNVKGMASEPLEVDYTSLIDCATIDNTDVNAPVEGIIISDRLEYKLNAEALKTTLIYIILAVVSFIIGRV